MPLDGVTAMYVATELNGRLTGGRVEKIGQPSRYALLLSIRSDGQTHRLLLDANPQQPRLGLIESTRPNPEKAPHFTMMLRKHLAGATLMSVACRDYERVFFFAFRSRNEMGDLVPVTLIAELMGRHSNLVLLNKDSRIIDAIRHVDSRVNRVRETLPAHPYVPPPPQNKIAPADMLRTLKDGTDIFAAAPSRSIADQIVRTTAGFSPFLAAEVSYLAAAGSQPAGELSEAERRLACAMFETLLARILSQDASPTLYFDPATERPADYHAYNLAYLKHKQSDIDIFLAMERTEAAAAEQEQFERERRALHKRIQNMLGLTEKRIAVHAAEASEGEKAGSYKRSGDLLYAYLHTLNEGMERAVLPDFDSGEPVTIELAKTKSPARNAEQYYRRYRKAKTKAEMAGRFLQKDIVQRDYLLSLETALRLAADMDDLAALADELAGQTAAAVRPETAAEPSGLPGKPAGKKRKALRAKQKSEAKRAGKRPADERPNYRRYVAASGHIILIGRNNLQNDRLTLKDAAKDDLWLHVHQAPGSHVVVQGTLADLPDDTVLQAAGLAAWFSTLNKGTGSLIDVDYCPAGHVKKGSGQKPGQVIYERYYQVRVAPLDPASLPPDASL